MWLDQGPLDLENSILVGNGDDNLYLSGTGGSPVTADHSLLGTDVTLDTDHGGNVFAAYLFLEQLLPGL